jgi:hypothetical protein
MARIIWNRPANPPKWVADRLAICEWDLGDALHAIKQASGLAVPTVSPYPRMEPLPTIRDR